MRYALTGATGFVGGRLAELLVQAGHTVTAFVRDTGRARALADQGVRLVPGDLADHASLRAAADGADGLFHVAGWYQLGAREYTPARRINVDGTRAVLAAVRETAVPRLVYTSTLSWTTSPLATCSPWSGELPVRRTCWQGRSTRWQRYSKPPRGSPAAPRR
jgi:nucleoside-diphosphate-sugar epimerase